MAIVSSTALLSLLRKTTNQVNNLKSLYIMGNEPTNKTNWQLIIKIIIAVLSAILGVIGGAKVQAVGTFINGII